LAVKCEARLPVERVRHGIGALIEEIRIDVEGHRR
jgi:hypothetical protein